MADAPGHRLGQIIGETLEQSILPILEGIASQHGLYLDKFGRRPARRGNRLTWVDDLGNKHDLDFVLERGGTDVQIGRPAAFIESAWRRYSKHSKNKAQEMQGALLPLLSKYSDDQPFAGVIVAGEWTGNALQQMRSSGFAVLHLRYADIVAAFAKFGIDVRTDERTSDDHLSQQVGIVDSMFAEDRAQLARSLCDDSSEEYRAFADKLEASLSRRVTRILVLPLHSGGMLEFSTINDAAAINRFDIKSAAVGDFVRFEVQLAYSNGDTVVATFEKVADAVRFLESFI